MLYLCVLCFIQGNELAVGNVDGTLAIFKGRGHKPWRKCSNLGMVCISLVVGFVKFLISYFYFFK